MKLAIAVAIPLFGMFLCVFASDKALEGEGKSTLHQLDVRMDTLDATVAQNAARLKVYGRFVRESELKGNSLFRSPVPDPGDDPREEEIYLITLTLAESEPGKTYKRLRNVLAEVRLPNGYEIEFPLVSRSLLTRGQCWNLVQVVNRDSSSEELRARILKSKPAIEIISVAVK